MVITLEEQVKSESFRSNRAIDAKNEQILEIGFFEQPSKTLGYTSDELVIMEFYSHLLGNSKYSSIPSNYYVNERLEEIRREAFSQIGLPISNYSNIDTIILDNKEIIDKNLFTDYSKYSFLANFTPELFVQYMIEELYIEEMADCVDYSKGYPDMSKCSEKDLKKVFSDWIDRETHFELKKRGYGKRFGQGYHMDDWNSPIYDSPLAEGEYEKTRNDVLRSAVLRMIDMGNDDKLVAGSLKDNIMRVYTRDDSKFSPKPELVSQKSYQ